MPTPPCVCSCKLCSGLSKLADMLSVYVSRLQHGVGTCADVRLCHVATACRFAACCRYGGGRAGLSDTMAGTLWVTDALFAFAQGGARAFHLHWGHGGMPYEGGSPNVGVQTNFDYNVSWAACLCSGQARSPVCLFHRSRVGTHMCPVQNTSSSGGRPHCRIFFFPTRLPAKSCCCCCCCTCCMCPVPHTDTCAIQAVPQCPRALVWLPVLGDSVCWRLQQERRHTVHSSLDREEGASATTCACACAGQQHHITHQHQQQRCAQERQQHECPSQCGNRAG